MEECFQTRLFQGLAIRNLWEKDPLRIVQVLRVEGQMKVPSPKR